MVCGQYLRSWQSFVSYGQGNLLFILGVAYASTTKGQGAATALMFAPPVLFVSANQAHP